MSDTIQKLEALGIDLSKLKSNQIQYYTVCPKCSQDRKKKNVDCLSVNTETGQYNCHHCEWHGGVKTKEKFEVKEYIRPVFVNRTDLSKKELDYFHSRGISPSTLLKLRVTSGPEYMPQIQKETNTLQFNYFRKDQLVNVKFRDAIKNFKMVKDAELIFYNLDSIENSDWCVITEGEIDAMSWVECGVDEVVSVPNGASKGNQRLEYLDNCYEYFLNKTKIYLATDNDDAGRSLRDELARRLGYDRCVWIDFGDVKDSNEYLVDPNKDSLKSLLLSAKEFAIEGVFTIDDVWSDLEDIYNNGLPTGAKTGDTQFDSHLGLMPGELTMVTGIPGHGKSIYLDQISLKLCLNEQWRFAICSPESYPTAFYYARLIKRLIGKKFSKANIDEDLLLECREWIKSRYHLIAPPQGYDLDEILERARILVLKKGIKGLIIDPWNRIESNMPNGYNAGKWIQERLDKIIRFNQKNGVHTFLVAHPTKMPKDKDGINYVVPSLYSISGSGDFFNMTQNGFCVYHNSEKNITEIHFQKIKWEHLGKVGTIEYTYHEPTARFYVKGKESPERNWLKEPQDIFENTYGNSQYEPISVNTEEFDEFPF